MKVAEILHTDVPTASPSEMASTAWETMNERETDYLVVVRDGAVVGLVSRSDLGGPKGGAHRRMGRRIADLMHREVVTATPGTDVRRAASLMRRHRLGCLPVVQRHRLVGVVTVSDLLALLERRLSS